MATCAILRVTPLSNTAVTKPLLSIWMLVRLPNAVPLVVIDWVTDWLSNWVRPPVAELMLKATVWLSMPRLGAQFTAPAAGAPALEGPKAIPVLPGGNRV